MNELTTGIGRFLREEDGVTAIEYGLIAALIAVAIIATVWAVGDKLNVTFRRIASALENPTGQGG